MKKPSTSFANKICSLFTNASKTPAEFNDVIRLTKPSRKTEIAQFVEAIDGNRFDMTEANIIDRLGKTGYLKEVLIQIKTENAETLLQAVILDDLTIKKLTDTLTKKLIHENSKTNCHEKIIKLIELINPTGNANSNNDDKNNPQQQRTTQYGTFNLGL